MNLERLATALVPADVVQPAPTDVRGLAYDARAVEPGFLFFCVPGARADGHDFAPDAVARGAVALVVERPLEVDVPQLVVPDAKGGHEGGYTASASCSSASVAANDATRTPSSLTGRDGA